MTLQQYLATSRQVRYSILFAVPLLLLYEGLSEEIREGDFDDGYRWRYRIELAGANSQMNLEDTAAFVITVWISWKQGQKTKQMDVSALTIARSLNS